MELLLYKLFHLGSMAEGKCIQEEELLGDSVLTKAISYCQRYVQN